MQGIIDRIENNIVVIEVKDKVLNVSKSLFEGDFKEGDSVDIILEEGTIIKVVKNEEATKSRKEYMENLVKDMWQ